MYVSPTHTLSGNDDVIYLSEDDSEMLKTHCKDVSKIGDQELEFPLRQCVGITWLLNILLIPHQVNLNHYDITLDDIDCLIKDTLSLTRDEQKQVKESIQKWLVNHQGYMDDQVKTVQICTTHQKALRLKKLNSFSLKVNDFNYRCDITAEIMTDGSLGIITWSEPWNKKDVELNDAHVYYWQTTRGTWKIHTTCFSRSSSCSSSVVGD